MYKARLHAYSYLIIAALLWGIAAPVIKYTLGDIAPTLLLAYRFGLSTVIGIAFFIRSPSELPRNGTQWVHTIVYSILTITLSLGFFFWGMTYTSSITGSLIGSALPLFITIAGALFLSEHITNIEKIGIILALIGTGITVFGSNGNTDTYTVHSFLGNILILLACVFGAIGEVYSKRALRDHVSPLAVTNISFIIGFICFAALSIFTYSPHAIVQTITTLPIQAHLGIWYMAIFSGTIAYFLYNHGMQTLRIGESSLFSYLSPIFTIPLSLFFLHEHITVPYIIGACVIGVGVAVAEIKKRKAYAHHRGQNHHSHLKRKRRR